MKLVKRNDLTLSMPNFQSKLSELISKIYRYSMTFQKSLNICISLRSIHWDLGQKAGLDPLSKFCQKGLHTYNELQEKVKYKLKYYHIEEMVFQDSLACFVFGTCRQLEGEGMILFWIQFIILSEETTRLSQLSLPNNVSHNEVYNWV